MDKIEIIRREEKYLISYKDYLCIKKLLSRIMICDNNARNMGEYYVRSMYFDTADNDDYYSKINGLLNKYFGFIAPFSRIFGSHQFVRNVFGKMDSVLFEKILPDDYKYIGTYIFKKRIMKKILNCC